MNKRNQKQIGITSQQNPSLHRHTWCKPHLLNEMTSFGTWLHVAVKRGNMEIIEYLISKGIDVNVKDGTFDANALKTAAGAGQLEVVRYLIDNSSIMDTSLAQRNPLFGAIYSGHMNVVKELVERGIDVSVRYTSESLNDMDAHDYAKEFGQTEIANYLKGKIRNQPIFN